MHYLGKFVVEVDESYDLILANLKGRNFKHFFKQSLAPPHFVEISMGPLDEEGLDRWTSFFNERKIHYRLYTAEWERVKHTFE